MAKFSRFNKWWLFQILFLLAAIIVVELYLRSNPGDRVSSENPKAVGVNNKTASSSIPGLANEKLMQLELIRASICLDVDEGRPLMEKKSFNRYVDKLYCYSQIKGLLRAHAVNHLWYYGNDLKSEKSVEANDSRSDVWSMMEMHPNWVGKWRVDIVADKNQLLGTVNFELY